MREQIARMLCETNGINPDADGVGLGKCMKLGRQYKLWEFQAEQYVDPILKYMKAQDETSKNI